METIRYCDRVDCDNPGVWSPTIRIWAKGHSKKDHPPIEVPIPVVACHDHKAKLGILDIMDDDGFRRVNGIVKALGFKAPDRGSAELQWIAVPQSPSLN